MPLLASVWARPFQPRHLAVGSVRIIIRTTAVRAFQVISQSLGTTIDSKLKPCKQPFALPILQRRLNMHPNIIDPVSTCPVPLYSCLNPLPFRYNRYVEPPIRGLKHQLLMPPCFEKIADRPDQNKPTHDHQNVGKPVAARYTQETT